MAEKIYGLGLKFELVDPSVPVSLSVTRAILPNPV